MIDQALIDTAYPCGTFPDEAPLRRIGLAKRAAVWEACGGDNRLENLVGACVTCNQKKDAEIPG
jgi:hypothetical protein